MKLYTFLIHDTKEYYAKRTMNELKDYLVHWYLTDFEAEVLLNTGIFNHDQLGIIEFNTMDV